MDMPVPINYKLCIRPDLKKLEFEGSVELTASVQSAVSEVTLNLLELAVWQCEIATDNGFLPCAFFVDPHKETLRIIFPGAVSGVFRLKIGYSGHINDKLAGFYRSTHGEGGNTRLLAVTQFEESAARMAFPCFDHPRFKATFDVTLIVDNRLSAISNGAVLSETEEGDGMKRVVFETTPKMSTYLLFFGVGNFEWATDEKDRRVRAAAMPGTAGRLSMGIDFGRKSLEFCEEYFGIPYPMSKLDLIAVPDFAFGAMENWGAVVFRENLLLFDAEKTSQAGKERICEVIAHEIVHQWFGNLVSPADWKYLWLNESFATFFANCILDFYCPEWRVRDQFLHSQTATAMVRDALFETTAIEIPGGEHVVINAATAPIIYNKGGSILNQMREYIGEDLFRKGLSRYLSTHAYDCAESRHLWESYSAVTDRPVAHLMKSWVENPGFPIITVEQTGTELILQQERFTYLEPGQKDTPPFSAVWPVPLAVEVFFESGTSKRFDILMDGKEARLHVEPSATAVKINAGQTGFYRVHYASPEMLEALGKRVSDKTLSAADRWGLEEDLFALARSGRYGLDRYLDFLSAYEAEDDFLPIIGIAENLHLSYLIVGDERKERVSAPGKQLLERVLHKIGYSPNDREANTTRMLRDAILFRAVLFGVEAAQFRGNELFETLLGGREIHPDIQRSAMQIGAWLSPRRAFEWFRERLKTSESEHERMNILMAIGCLSNETVLREALSYSLVHVPRRNRHLPLASCAANPSAMTWLWEWIVSHMPDLEQLHPVLFERVIDALVPLCGLGREESVKAFFNDYLMRKKSGREAIMIALEFLRVNQRMRNR